jgi:hypothetical protein
VFCDYWLLTATVRHVVELVLLLDLATIGLFIEEWSHIYDKIRVSNNVVHNCKEVYDFLSYFNSVQMFMIVLVIFYFEFLGWFGLPYKC